MPTPINVNLISGRAFELKKEKTAQAKVQFVTAFGLICFVGLTLMVLALAAFTNLQVTKVQKAAKKEEIRISQLAFAEDLYLVVQNKVELLEDYFALRREVVDLMDELLAALPEGIVLSGINLDNEKLVIEWGLEAPSFEELNQFVDLVEAKVQEGEYGAVENSSLGRDETGKYTAKITINYAPES